MKNVARLLILFWVLGFLACQSEKIENKETRYFCGAEEVEEGENGELVFRDNEAVFHTGHLQSDEYAFEGNYAVQLDSANQYGMSILFTDVSKGEFFSASVWQNEISEPGALVCKVEGKYSFSFNSLDNGFYEYKDGWRKHVLQFSAIEDLDSLTFFIFVGGHQETSYYDNLEIIRRLKRPQGIVGDEVLNIALPDTSQQKLNKNIRKAAGSEIIRNKYKDYEDATLVVDDERIPVEMRLKGDWTDHLLSGSPSYRIKTKSGTAYKGLRSFSIQHPKTRNYMHEWFLHQLCDHDDLLSTHYSFLEVKVNDEYQGVYALEEHFDKQLIESRKRREGPILKMDETAFWKLAVYAREHGLDRIPAAYYEASINAMFKEGRTLDSPSLRAQFENGAVLLNHFKYGYERPDLIFDMEQAATYYALMDLGNVHHSLAWHNRRFYYNPVTAKLEHVGFDMIPMVRPLNSTLARQTFKAKKELLSIENGLNYYFFKNKKFRSVYLRKLRQYSSEAFLDSTFEAYATEIDRIEGLVKQEMPGYFFQKDLYYEKAALIRNELKNLEADWDAFMAKDEEFNLEKNQLGKYELGENPFFLEDIGVNGYRSKIDSTRYLLEFENYHYDSVTITGYAVKANKDSLLTFERPLMLAGFKGGGQPDTLSIVLNLKPSRFYFIGHNVKQDTARKKYNKWKKPNHEHPRIALEKSFKTTSPYYRAKQGKLIFKQGNYNIDKMVYIPSDWEVLIQAGTHINFVHGGGLITNATTRFEGTETSPIVFTSSDSSGRGVTILQGDSVNIKYVEMYQMNTLDYHGWTLTGALTIYESPTSIHHLKMEGNQCEDGLNVIRSNFDIQHLYISNTFSDGFDADFCTGNFSHATFEKTGNDCIDFSGSEVTISDVSIRQSGDKGVSAGERSHLELVNVKIEGAVTGLASKDDSHIEGDSITVNHAEVGISLFQKKPEYGPSTMTLKHTTYQNLGQLGLIEMGSKAVVNGKAYRGYQKLDIDALYARFE